jgi:hypothetical protein
MSLSKIQLDEIIAKLHSYTSTPADLIVTLLGSKDHIDDDVVHNIHQNADKILASLARNPSTSVVAFQWAHETATNTYIDQIHALIKDKTGLWFSAKHCTAQSLKEFDIAGLAEQMNAKAPHLWELLGTLLAADSGTKVAREARGNQCRAKKSTSTNMDGDFVMANGDDSEAEYWRDQDDPMPEDEHDEDEATECREALITIVSSDKMAPKYT